MNNRLINTKVAGGGGGCTDIVDNYDPFGGSGVALYQLNGNGVDLSGNYSANSTNNVAWVNGVFGQAAQFNGSNAVIDTPVIPITNTTTFTNSSWVYISSLSIGNIIPFSQVSSSNSNTFISIAIRPSSNNVELIRKDTSSVGIGVYESYTWSVGWHHVVWVCTPTNSKLYVNGSQIANTDYTQTSPLSFTTQSMGARLRPVQMFYAEGVIDQNRFFNTALTSLEVEALYTEELCICDGTVDTLDILGDGSCIATYQLDGNANDLSGNYSGTPTDVSYGVGEFDLAGVFNGTSSYIDTNAKIPASLDFTISFWLKTTSTSSQYIFDTKAGYQTNGWRIYIASGAISYAEGNGVDNATTQTSPSSGYADGNWHNVVITRASGGIVNMYIDNIKVITNGSVGTYYMTSSVWQNDLHIGRVSSSAQLFVNGSLDQVRIFNKALSAGEVTTLYNETACSVPNPIENASFHYDPTTLSDGAVTAWSDSGTIGRDLDLVSASGTITKNTSAGIESVDIPFIQSNSYLRVGGSSYTTYSDYPTNTSFTMSMFVNVSTSYINFSEYVYLSNFSTASGVELGEFTNFIWRYGLNPQEYDVTPIIQGVDFWLYSDVTPAMDFRPYGTWRMLTVTFEYNPSGTSYLKWYYDGTLIHTVSNTGTWGASATSFSLGAANNLATRRDGGIKYGDVLGFYGEAKTQSEIVEMYRLLKGKYGL